MSDERYLSSAQQAAIAVYGALHERPLAGMTAAELASACEITRDQAFRAVRNWAHAGFVERAGSSGLWRLTRRAAVLSERMREVLMAAHLAGREDSA